MLDHRKRWVLFYDLVLRSLPEEAPTVGLAELLRDLHLRQSAGESVWIINKNTAAFRIVDMKIMDDKQAAIFLLQYADKAIADPVFSDLNTGTLRAEPKLEGEGVAVSAHVALSLAPNMPMGSAYLTLLEHVPGITKSRLEPFLSHEFRKIPKTLFVGADGKKRKCRALADLQGHPSQSLVEDLESGTLSEIELIRNKRIKPQFDEDGYMAERAYSLKLKAKKQLQGAEAINVIERYKERAREKRYNDMKIRYKNAEGKGRSIEIPTSIDKASELLFNRMERFTVDDNLPQCLDSIRDDVADKMLGMLMQQRQNS